MLTVLYAYAGSEILVAYVGTSLKRIHAAATEGGEEFDWWVVWDNTGRCGQGSRAPVSVSRPLTAFIVL